MTQKEKIMKAFTSLVMIKNSINSLDREAEDYDMRFHRKYVNRITDLCDETLNLLK